jgi:thiamine pyrophosphokinase
MEENNFNYPAGVSLKKQKMNDNQLKSDIIIVADGSFPRHEIPLSYIRNAKRIICCDGSAENLIKAGFIPDAIIGDMDSLNESIAGRFQDRIFRDSGQETNDLTKAVAWCSERGFNELVILAATGKREDHTIGNISLLAEYNKNGKAIMVTDTGILRALGESSAVLSFPGQQVSIFAIDPEIEITSRGLKYPLERKKLTNWWVATLNESTGDSFSLEFAGGPVIVYLKFME